MLTLSSPGLDKEIFIKFILLETDASGAKDQHQEEEEVLMLARDCDFGVSKRVVFRRDQVIDGVRRVGGCGRNGWSVVLLGQLLKGSGQRERYKWVEGRD